MAWRVVGTCRYTPWGDEKLDPAKQPTHGDTKESFSVFRPVSDHERRSHPNPLQGRNQWPDESAMSSSSLSSSSCGGGSFKRTLLRYFEQVGLNPTTGCAMNQSEISCHDDDDDDDDFDGDDDDDRCHAEQPHIHTHTHISS